MNDVVLPAANELGEFKKGSNIYPRGDLSLKMLDPMTTKSCRCSIVPDTSLVGFALPSGDFNVECRCIKAASQIDHMARCTSRDETGDDL